MNIGSWSSSDPAFSARLGGTNNFKFRANLSAPDSKIVDFHNNGSTDNEVVASISASGAGNFLGGVTVGGNGATQYKGSWISDGTLRIGGTLPASPNIELNASDGSASFAGDINAYNGFSSRASRNDPPSASKVGMRLSPQSLNFGISSTSPQSAPIFNSFLTNDGTERVLITADGSASFAGKVTAADYNLEALPPLSTAP